MKKKRTCYSFLLFPSLKGNLQKRKAFLEISQNVGKVQPDFFFLNFSFDKNRLKTLVSWFLQKYGPYKTLNLLEKLKEFGFSYATIGGLSLGIDDLNIPREKISSLHKAETSVTKDFFFYRNAKITGIERIQRFIYIWNQTNDTLKQEVLNYFETTDLFNPIYMMAFSGARGNMSQVRQLVGMRGLMSDPQGQIIDFPIQSNFREGLSLTEYLISTYGARKGIVDTALRTATAGYLTRRLVDVAQHVIVSKFDCETNRGIYVFDMKESKKTIYSFEKRLIGRVLAENIFCPSSLSSLNELTKQEMETTEKTEEKSQKMSGIFDLLNTNTFVQKATTNSEKRVIGLRNQEIDLPLAQSIQKITKKAFVRSPLTCDLPRFVCQLCYGWSLSQGKLVSIGEAVGVIAAQSIGEPGTQLTMRTFHTGGVFAGGLTDQIFAPFNGQLHYLQNIPGKCIRTFLKEIAFFTKSRGSFLLTKTTEPLFELKFPDSAQTLFEQDEIELQRNWKQNSKNICFSEIYRIPPYAILFVRHGEFVQKKQLLAQFSSDGQKQFQYGSAEQTLFANLSGEIFLSHSKNIQLIIEKRTSDDISELEEKSDIFWKSKNWTTMTIFSGKIFFLSFSKNFLFYSGDFINKNTQLHRIFWKKPPQSSLFAFQNSSPFSPKLTKNYSTFLNHCQRVQRKKNKNTISFFLLDLDFFQELVYFQFSNSPKYSFFVHLSKPRSFFLKNSIFQKIYNFSFVFFSKHFERSNFEIQQKIFNFQFLEKKTETFFQKNLKFLKQRNSMIRKKQLNHVFFKVPNFVGFEYKFSFLQFFQQLQSSPKFYSLFQNPHKVFLQPHFLSVSRKKKGTNFFQFSEICKKQDIDKENTRDGNTNVFPFQSFRISPKLSNRFSKNIVSYFQNFPVSNKKSHKSFPTFVLLKKKCGTLPYSKIFYKNFGYTFLSNTSTSNSSIFRNQRIYRKNGLENTNDLFQIFTAFESQRTIEKTSENLGKIERGLQFKNFDFFEKEFSKVFTYYFPQKSHLNTNAIFQIFSFSFRLEKAFFQKLLYFEKNFFPFPINNSLFFESVEKSLTNRYEPFFPLYRLRTLQVSPSSKIQKLQFFEFKKSSLFFLRFQVFELFQNSKNIFCISPLFPSSQNFFFLSYSSSLPLYLPSSPNFHRQNFQIRSQQKQVKPISNFQKNFFFFEFQRNKFSSFLGFAQKVKRNKNSDFKPSFSQRKENAQFVDLFSPFRRKLKQKNQKQFSDYFKFFEPTALFSPYFQEIFWLPQENYSFFVLSSSQDFHRMFDQTQTPKNQILSVETPKNFTLFLTNSQGQKDSFSPINNGFISLSFFPNYRTNSSKTLKKGKNPVQKIHFLQQKFSYFSTFPKKTPCYKKAKITRNFSFFARPSYSFFTNLKQKKSKFIRFHSFQKKFSKQQFGKFQGNFLKQRFLKIFLENFQINKVISLKELFLPSIHSLQAKNHQKQTSFLSRKSAKSSFKIFELLAAKRKMGQRGRKFFFSSHLSKSCFTCLPFFSTRGIDSSGSKSFFSEKKPRRLVSTSKSVKRQEKFCKNKKNVITKTRVSLRNQPGWIYVPLSNSRTSRKIFQYHQTFVSFGKTFSDTLLFEQNKVFCEVKFIKTTEKVRQFSSFSMQYSEKFFRMFFQNYPVHTNFFNDYSFSTIPISFKNNGNILNSRFSENPVHFSENGNGKVNENQLCFFESFSKSNHSKNLVFETQKFYENSHCRFFPNFQNEKKVFSCNLSSNSTIEKKKKESLISFLRPVHYKIIENSQSYKKGLFSSFSQNSTFQFYTNYHSELLNYQRVQRRFFEIEKSFHLKIFSTFREKLNNWPNVHFFQQTVQSRLKFQDFRNRKKDVFQKFGFFSSYSPKILQKRFFHSFDSFFRAKRSLVVENIQAPSKGNSSTRFSFEKEDFSFFSSFSQLEFGLTLFPSISLPKSFVTLMTRSPGATDNRLKIESITDSSFLSNDEKLTGRTFSSLGFKNSNLPNYFFSFYPIQFLPLVCFLSQKNFEKKSFSEKVFQKKTNTNCQFLKVHQFPQNLDCFFITKFALFFNQRFSSFALNRQKQKNVFLSHSRRENTNSSFWLNKKKINFFLLKDFQFFQNESAFFSPSSCVGIPKNFSISHVFKHAMRTSLNAQRYSKSPFSRFTKEHDRTQLIDFPNTFLPLRIKNGKTSEVKTIQGFVSRQKKLLKFQQNFFLLNHPTLFGTTKSFNSYEGELLKFSTNELNWWKKAAEISTLQKLENFFIIVTKKDLFSGNLKEMERAFPRHLLPLSFVSSTLSNGFRDKNEFYNKEKQFPEKQVPFKDFFENFLLSTLQNKFSNDQTLVNDSFITVLAEEKKNKAFPLSFDQNKSMDRSHIFSFLTKYENKIYKLHSLKVSSVSSWKNPFIGTIFVGGDSFLSFALRRPGQLVHLSENKATFRRIQPFLISPKGIFHFSTLPYVSKNLPIVTLPYQTLQAGDIVQGIPKVEQFFEARTTIQGRLFVSSLPILIKGLFQRYSSLFPLEQATRQTFLKIQQLIVDGVQRVYRSQGVSITDKHLEVIVRQMTTKVQIVYGAQTGFFPGELVDIDLVEKINSFLLVKIRYEPVVLGITRASLEVESFLSASSFQQTTKILSFAAISRKKDFLKGLKENLLVGNLIPSGTGYFLLSKSL
jgi:hypothetical protein